MSTVRLAKNQDRRLRAGHPWVFSNEIAAFEGDPAPGAEVRVLDHRGSLVGVGLYNPHSLISVRLFARRHRPFDEGLVRGRLARALKLRERTLPGEQTYRLIHSEGDFLPGLIVDRYGAYLGVQSLTLGIDQRIEKILDVLDRALSPRGIVCRRDSPSRIHEGLPLLEPIVLGTVPDTAEVPYEDLTLATDLRGGQKTGEFLDQRANRRRSAELASGRAVLDLYCYTGIFAVLCARAGARSVLGIDRSSPAVERARMNAALNAGGMPIAFQVAEVEETLEALEGEGAQFDMIILDPPGLVKSRKALREGTRKYVEINAAAMRRLRPGGILVTASCSHLVDEVLLLGILRESAKRARSPLRLVEIRGQSRDHPVLLAVKETSYLTLAILERTDETTEETPT